MNLVSVLSLALGIGGTTAVFSLADALLFRPLPAIHRQEELVAVVGIHAQNPARSHALSFADYVEYAGRGEVVRGLAAMADCDLSLTCHGPAERVSGLAVSGNYFEVLGLTPARGRLLARADEGALVAVLGYGLWQRQFGGDPGAVGSPVTLNGKPVTIVGIAPQDFIGTDLTTRREIWFPLGSYSEIAAGALASFFGKHDRAHEWLTAIGRLSPTAGLVRAQEAFSLTATQLAAAYPRTNTGRGVRLLPLGRLALGPGSRARAQGFAARLMAVVGVVLAVAVMNVAGLLLSRAVSRRREIAVRVSLGASPRRLVRQLSTEGLVLAFCGGAAGIGVARVGLPLLERMELPVSVAVRGFVLSDRVLGVALLLTLAACLVFALVPSLQAVRTEVVPALRGEAPRRRPLRLGLREILVIFQVASSFLVLVAAGLLLRTVENLGSIAPGFDPARVLATTLDLAPAGYRGRRVTAFYADLLARLRHLPGVVDASMVSALPVMGGDLEVDLQVSPADAPPGSAEADNETPVRHVLVGSRYFQTVGMKMMRGRDFSGDDGASAAGEVILNESAARRLWPGKDALGRQLRLAQTAAPFTVVGLVSDSTYSSLKETRQPMLYLAHTQSEKSFIGDLLAPQMTLLVRAAGDPRQLLGAVREQVRAEDPRLPVFRTTTLESLLDATVGVERQAAALYSGLAFVAVALAMLGLFGVLTRAIVEQTRAIGLRIACGATPGDVRRLILRRSSILVLCGLAAGAAGAFPASRLVASQLYGVGAEDPVTWFVTSLLLLGVALLVATIPASRAATIDPVVAMRYE